MHQGIVRALHGEFVGRGDEWQVCEPGNLSRRGLGEPRRSVDAGSDCRSPQREAVDALQRIFNAMQIVAQHSGVARPLLPKGERRSVLHVGAANFDDVAPCIGFCGNGIVQQLYCGDQPPLDIDSSRDMHGRRNESLVDCDMFT